MVIVFYSKKRSNEQKLKTQNQYGLFLFQKPINWREKREKKRCPAPFFSFFSPVVSLARKKQSAVHTLGASAYKAHDQFSRKKKDFKCALWSVKYGKCHSHAILNFTLLSLFINIAKNMKKFIGILQEISFKLLVLI